MSDLTIHRYDVDLDDWVEVEMPKDAVIIHAEISDRINPTGIALWAVVDPGKPLTRRVIYVRGTGHRLGDAASARHIASLRMTLASGAVLVWHVFDGGVAGDE